MSELTPAAAAVLDMLRLDSIWERIQWEFLDHNPQLESWLQGSKLRATPDPDVFLLTVVSADTVDWLSTHTFAIRRGLSQEMGRPVEVRVVAREGVK